MITTNNDLKLKTLFEMFEIYDKHFTEKVMVLFLKAFEDITAEDLDKSANQWLGTKRYLFSIAEIRGRIKYGYGSKYINIPIIPFNQKEWEDYCIESDLSNLETKTLKFV